MVRGPLSWTVDQFSEIVLFKPNRFDCIPIMYEYQDMTMDILHIVLW